MENLQKTMKRDKMRRKRAYNLESWGGRSFLRSRQITSRQINMIPGNSIWSVVRDREIIK